MIIDATSTSITFEYWSVEGGGTLVDTYTIGDPTGPTAETITFQEGVDGYIGTQDTFLQEAEPGNVNGSECGLNGIVTIRTAKSSSRTWA